MSKNSIQQHQHHQKMSGVVEYKFHFLFLPTSTSLAVKSISIQNKSASMLKKSIFTTKFIITWTSAFSFIHFFFLAALDSFTKKAANPNEFRTHESSRSSVCFMLGRIHDVIQICNIKSARKEWACHSTVKSWSVRKERKGKVLSEKQSQEKL